jgi:hypothetical protein
VDLVERVCLVRPKGLPRWYSKSAPLFAFGLASLGAVGIIDRVVIRTIPYVPITGLHIEQLPCWTALDEALRPMVDLLDSFWVAEVRHETISSISAHYGFLAATPRKLPLLYGRSAQLVVDDQAKWSDARRVKLIRAFATRRKLWTDNLIDLSSVGGVLSLLDQERQHGFLVDVPSIIYALVIRVKQSVDFPLSAHGGPSSDCYKIGLGIYLFPEPKRTARLRAELVAWNAQVRAMGARPYRHGVAPLDARTFEELYGVDALRLRALRARCDPSGLFQQNSSA